MPMPEFTPGQRVRLKSLQARADLNGAHATVESAASSSEADELAQKQRLKVTTALTEESLAVRLANVEIVGFSEIVNYGVVDFAFSTADFGVAQHPLRGHTWVARKKLRAGRVLLRDEPLLVFRTADHLGDPVMRELQDRVAPFLGAQPYPPEAVALFDRIAERIAEREFSQLSAVAKRRYLALADAFAPAAKTLGGRYKTNSFAHIFADGYEGAIVYDIVSRLNHSCAPNLASTGARGIHGFADATAEVAALRDVAEGEELFISYLTEDDLEKPTSARRALLQSKYNFVCGCGRCEPG